MDTREIPRLKKRYGARARMRVPAMVVATILTAVAAVGMAGVHVWGFGIVSADSARGIAPIRDDVLHADMDGDVNGSEDRLFPSVPCPSASGAAKIVKDLLQRRAAAMEAGRLLPLAAVQTWDLVVMDAVELARRHEVGESFVAPVYDVEVNSVTGCFADAVKVVSTILARTPATNQSPGDGFVPVVLRITLVGQPARISDVKPLASG